MNSCVGRKQNRLSLVGRSGQKTIRHEMKTVKCMLQTLGLASDPLLFSQNAWDILASIVEDPNEPSPWLNCS